MSFYVINVQTGKELDFLTHARERIDPAHATFYFPRRKLSIRKKGQRKEVSAPIFPGYIFLQDGEIGETLFQAIKRVPGFYRFLESNQRIIPLSGDDLELISHFIKFGEVIGKSTVKFDENSRIYVLSGPLEGLEGKIVKIDKRKQRAKVQLDLYQESFLVDFGFELLGSGLQ
ncbi:MAG: antiterminator LoaP [Spirochaetales bacterium]